jgi:hypothetical protein
MVDLPHPDTPMTITIAGAGAEAPFAGLVSIDINSLLQALRRDP